MRQRQNKQKLFSNCDLLSIMLVTFVVLSMAATTTLRLQGTTLRPTSLAMERNILPYEYL